jgi:uncharacterized protein (DUF952 family)
MPQIIGSKVRVVDTGSLTIDEWVGNVATQNDTVSIATVVVSTPTNEPWLTLHYDEWLCVTTGKIELEYYEDGIVEKKVLVVNAGETAMISKGERFRPVFPVGNTSYIPICLPAFSPDRCIREEEEGEGVVDTTSSVSRRLAELHLGSASSHTTMKSTNNNAVTAEIPSADGKKDQQEEEVLYHMCQKDLWDAAVQHQVAYFPPTFIADGRFTHATAVPSRLITTANHFYTQTTGDWICLQLSRSALLKLGIDTVFEEAKPVGEAATHEDWDKGGATTKWICPHIYGGLPTHIAGIVTQTFHMTRNKNDGSFVNIVGLTD